MLRLESHRRNVLSANFAQILGDLFLYRRHTPRRNAERVNWAKNAMVGALIASFVLSPITSAFAQSSTSATTTSGTTPPSTSSTSAPSSGTQPTAQVPAPTAAPASSSPTPPPAQPAGPSAPSSPAQVGPFTQQVLPGTFNPALVKIDKNTGALTMTYTITLPPGRNGLQPDVSLQYSSQDTKLNSIFGEGWSSKIPYIERLNKMGVDKLYSTSTPNYFISSLDGELATSTATSTYVPRIENGAFNKYTFSSNSWTMTDKNGMTYTFGSSTQSQMNDPQNTRNVYRCMLGHA